MQGRENRAAEKIQGLDVISVRRNPYLVEYEEGRRLQRAVNGAGESSGTVAREKNRRPAGAVRQRDGSKPAERSSRHCDAPVRRRQDLAARKAARERRKRKRRRRRMMVCACLLCLFMVCVLILIKAGGVSAAEPADYGTGEIQEIEQEGTTKSPEVMVQGLPADVYAKHPAWEENFLSPNDYSRPGDALPEVRDIFVHYTANPGTSAAQNRSYFEQQKDMHEASVSSHFIIGYEGEIIQCVPLDEIAYAVQTRNYDSISIECCYKAQDGSFTQETYDSLISLLAWLTEAYGLDTDHILRHYDCGGKKCPIYYTEHEDAWDCLKEDVAEYDFT